jgi:hypothetical protein
MLNHEIQDSVQGKMALQLLQFLLELGGLGVEALGDCCQLTASY